MQQLYQRGGGSILSQQCERIKTEKNKNIVFPILKNTYGSELQRHTFRNKFFSVPLFKYVYINFRNLRR